jgi:hypothetical protein
MGKKHIFDHSPQNRMGPSEGKALPAEPNNLDEWPLLGPVIRINLTLGCLALGRLFSTSPATTWKLPTLPKEMGRPPPAQYGGVYRILQWNTRPLCLAEQLGRTQTWG